MTQNKEQSILDLLVRLHLSSRGWQVVDHWEADRSAIGVATNRDPRRIVYVSTYARDPGRYDYECEMPDGPNAEDYAMVASGENVDYDALVSAMESHLGNSDAPIQRG